MLSILKKISRPKLERPLAKGREPFQRVMSGRELTAELKRIRTTRRYQPMTTYALGAPLHLIDGLSFFYSFQEIFEKGIYSFPAESDSPLILDCGANIGLSIVWFKRRYARSRIVGFEADPRVFAVLQRNLHSFGLRDVEVVNKALWDGAAEVEFAVEGADGGRVSAADGGGSQAPERIVVPATRLGPWLQQPVDMLKLDIEGAEYRVLVDCADGLRNVRNLFVEYHSFAGQRQALDEVLQVLIAADFRIQIHTQFSSPRPLIERRTQLGMDLQLNIFGYREPS